MFSSLNRNVEFMGTEHTMIHKGTVYKLTLTDTLFITKNQEPFSFPLSRDLFRENKIRVRK